MLKFRIPWSVRLIRARIRGKFTYADQILATSWETCAVGEKHGYPGEDVGLNKLRKHHPTLWRSTRERGLEFMSAVGDDRVHDAIYEYLEIRKLKLPKWYNLVTNSRD